MSSNVVFVTPTYRRDYERFCLQRESIERCGITIEHIGIIDHEDLPLFKDMPFQKGLTLLSTKDVLPAKVEARRTARGYPRKNPLHWVKPKPLSGWMVQQLIKLSAVSAATADGIVCLDSDTFFVDRVDHTDFYDATGRLHLYESDKNLDAEMCEWYIKSCRLFGVRLWQLPVKQYTHTLVPMKCSVVRDMMRFMEQKYHHPWYEVMLGHDMIFEYMSYGVFSRHINGLENLAPVEPSLCDYYWWPDEVKAMEADFVARISAKKAKAVLVNSNVGRPVSDYRSLVEQAWKTTGVVG